jgi:signal transduction histidine kinase
MWMIGNNHVQFDHKAIRIIQESLERIRGIVSRLLEFAPHDTDAMQPLDVSSLLKASSPSIASISSMAKLPSKPICRRSHLCTGAKVNWSRCL